MVALRIHVKIGFGVVSTSIRQNIIRLRQNIEFTAY